MPVFRNISQALRGAAGRHHLERVTIGIGILTPSAPETGLGRFSEHVVEGILRRDPGARSYHVSPAPSGTSSERKRYVRTAPIRRGWAGLASRLRSTQHDLPRELRSDGISIFYSTSHEGILHPPCPQVLTVLDLIPLHDRRAYPNLRLYFRTIFRILLRRARGVICISEATRTDMVNYFRYDRSRTAVAYLGYEEELFNSRVAPMPAKELGFSGYYLHVGSAAPAKNVPRIVEAFSKVTSDAVGLVMVGPRDLGDWRTVERTIEKTGVGGRLKIMGTVGRSELAGLYSGATGLVFPSLYEGFGLPALEAMACGCPVITSKRGSLPEVCGEAAVYVDPLDPTSIAEGMMKVLDDRVRADQLREKGLTQARTFSWTRTAQTIHDALIRWHG